MCHLMARVETKYFVCLLVGNGSVNSSATKGVAEDPHKVGLSPSCPNTCVLPCTYCGPLYEACWDL
jgi:hypothetical protein